MVRGSLIEKEDPTGGLQFLTKTEGRSEEYFGDLVEKETRTGTSTIMEGHKWSGKVVTQGCVKRPSGLNEKRNFLGPLTEKVPRRGGGEGPIPSRETLIKKPL